MNITFSYYTKCLSAGVGAGHPDEDELYESAIVSTNVVYEVVDDELVVLSDISETMPKIEILSPSKVCNFQCYFLLSQFCVWKPLMCTFSDVSFRLW